MNYRQTATFLLICVGQLIVGNFLATKGYMSDAVVSAFLGSIPGLICLLIIIAGGLVIARLIPWKGLPAVAYIVTLGCIVTIPGFPGAELITEHVSKISFVGLCTPILAYAGLAVGKDFDALKSQGWKIVLVGLFVFVGTFLGSAIIAEVVLRMMS